jgi:hypothetical protein
MSFLENHSIETFELNCQHELTETPAKFITARSPFCEISTDIVDIHAFSIFASFHEENIPTSSGPFSVGKFEEL